MARRSHLRWERDAPYDPERGIAVSHLAGPAPQETIMAKGQKRSNRETRKPKSDKPAPVPKDTLLGRALPEPARKK